MSRIRRGPVRLFALIALLVLAALPAMPAGAQIEPDPGIERVTVGAVLCTDASCFEYETLLDSFGIAAIDTATGDTLASCVTAATAPHTCVLELPAGASYDLAWDDAQVPDGYAWAGSLLHTADGPLGTATLIPFTPVQDIAPVEEPGHMVVQAALCTDATCNAFSGYLDFFIITAIDPVTGEQYSSCATDNLQQNLDHQCILDVPADGDVALEWYEDQVPDGYVAYGDPFPVGDPVVMTLGFYPSAADTPVTPAPVTTLPSTGSGPDAASPVTALTTSLLLASVLAAIAGVTIRRRVRLAPARQHARVR